MKMAFLVGDMGTNSAADLAVFNFIKGLQRYDWNAVVVTPWISEENYQRFSHYAEVRYLHRVKRRKGLGYSMFADYYLNTVGRKLRRLVKGVRADYFFHISGFGYEITREDFDVPLIYWCLGLPYTLFSSQPWMDELNLSPFLKGVVTLTSPFLIKKIGRRLKGFGFVLSGSSFVSNWLYFYTGIKSLVLYPPIDTEKFHPIPKRTTEKYLLVVGQRTEIDVPTIRQIAKQVPTVKVGSDEIDGCKNVGFVPGKQLIELYTNAVATIFPTRLEPFGYIPIESMACGTPVITYRYQGPSETVVNERTGWLEATPSDLVKRAEEVYKKGVSDNMRKACREHVCRSFSIEAVTEKLIELLDQCG